MTIEEYEKKLKTVECPHCGHSFRLNTINRLFSRQCKEYTRCPVCREDIPVDDSCWSEVNKLKDDFRLSMKKGKDLKVGDTCFCVGSDGGVEIVTIKELGKPYQGYGRSMDRHVEYNTGCQATVNDYDSSSGYGMYAAIVHFSKESAYEHLEEKLEKIKASIGMVTNHSVKPH